MRDYLTNISCEDFRALFNDFKTLVYKKVYKPIPYQKYRDMDKDFDNTYPTDLIGVEYDCIDDAVWIYTQNADYYFPTADQSFGTFLFEEMNFAQGLLELKHETTLTRSSDNNTVKNIKEDNIMKFNFDFGPVAGNDVRMSLYGLAVKNKSGSYVSYDAKAGNIMDVEVLNFDGARFLYKMPVAIKDVAIGDVIVHHRVPMFVVAIAVNGSFITAVDPVAGERKEIMLTKSPFGFDFVTKVVNLLGNLNTGADASNPFGNLGLMLALSDEGGNGVKEMLPLMMLSGAGSIDMSNPLMLYALFGNDSKSGNDNILPMLMMLNTQHPVPSVPSEGCTCGGHCINPATEA